jgi:hypothetical protein
MYLAIVLPVFSFAAYRVTIRAELHDVENWIRLLLGLMFSAALLLTGFVALVWKDRNLGRDRT